ncbi:MFS transporter [Demequina sp.]|uniref:MFS transporter n=1 Tax=Demequina sp. TaxID=2050685 RepID=UPI0025FACD8E|nr:MFS transporter [Demequina sp.]
MSDLTRTLELPRIDSPTPTSGELTHRAAFVEPEPTTLTIPVVGGGETVVLGEPEPGVRSIESLSLTPRRAGLALTALAVGAFATGANEASIVALSPTIAAGLGVPVASVGLLATAFALTVVIAAIPLTLLTGRLSRRLALGTTLAVWTVGVGIAASATSLGQLATGRVVSAAAHALFWGVVAPTAAGLFAPHLRARSVTRIMVGAAAAGVIGTPLITVAGTQLGWQAPYWGFAVLGVALTAALALTLPGKPPAPDPDQPRPQTRGDLPSLSAFLRVLAVTFVATVGMTTTWTYIVPFFTDVASVGTATVPVLFALGGTVAVGATLGVSRFLTRHAVPTVAVGLGLLTGAWTLLALGLGWSAILAQVLQAAGWAVLLAALLNWAMRHTPWRTEVGASTYTVTMNSGAAIGPLLGGLIVSRWGLPALPLVSLGLTLGAAAITAAVDRRTLRRLRVPRHVRMALEARRTLAARRREFQRRTANATARSAGTAVRRAGGALRGHVADLDTLLG